MSSARPECGEDCLECLEESVPARDDRNACLRSAQRGHLECLRYAHEKGCPWDKDICTEASSNGHLECLRYAHEHGCSWDEWTCYYASEGHVECFRYALENGCPSPGYTLKNGCPFPDFTLLFVHSSVVPYLHHHGIAISEDNSDDLRTHIREHIRRAWTLLRCASILLGAYRRSCERVYSPDGLGYREAETSFREALRKS